MTNSPSVEHTQDEQHTAEVSKVITMDSKVTFEVTNSNIWLNHLATTTIIQVVAWEGAGEVGDTNCGELTPSETGVPFIDLSIWDSEAGRVSCSTCSPAVGVASKQRRICAWCWWSFESYRGLLIYIFFGLGISTINMGSTTNTSTCWQNSKHY